MSQTTELVRVKAQIRALAEKTVSNGCTEAEAMAAAEMVGRLLERYALSMDEIEVREARCVQAEVPLAGQRRRPIDGCVPAIACFCDCKVWLARAPRQNPDADVFDSAQVGSRFERSTLRLARNASLLPLWLSFSQPITMLHFMIWFSLSYSGSNRATSS